MNQKLSHYRPFHEWPKASQGDFLAGLIEGDGNISKDQIRVSFNKKDRIVAENFVYTLGGNISDDDKHNRITWFINGPSLEKVLSLVNGRFVGLQKVKDLQRCFPKVKIKPSLLKVNLESAWLSGFMESDGSIGIVMEKKRWYINESNFSVRFFSKRTFVM